MTLLNFSVDLKAELRKITQRQHLNQVHYLVQLVRHALLHKPSSIHIQANQDWLSLTQDGSAFSVDEWVLLQVLTSSSSEAEKQKALIRLEARYGVAFLSLLLNAPYVYVGGPTGTLLAEKGSVRWGGRAEAQLKGYSVQIKREEANTSDERDELVYFASGASVPILFNHKPVNKAIELEPQIMRTSFKNELGQGAVGLPEEGDFCLLTFYKLGVRVGTKQFVPQNGKIYHAWWDSSTEDYEEHFRKTIEAGEQYIGHFSQGLYLEIPRIFSDLDNQKKARVKGICLALDRLQWDASYNSIPFFHSASREYALSLEDLEVLDQHFDGIPYLTSASRQMPAYLPKLAPEDVHFLGTSLKKKLKVISRKGRHSGMPPSAGSPQLDPAREGSAEKNQILSQLNLFDPFCHFHFSSNGFAVVTDTEGRKQVYLALNHPEVEDIIQNFYGRPETRPLARYLLLELAVRYSKNR